MSFGHSVIQLPTISHIYIYIYIHMANNPSVTRKKFRQKLTKVQIGRKIREIWLKCFNFDKSSSGKVERNT